MQKPDCIVLDYDLRDSTGLDFMAELARRGSEPPIIAITGNDSATVAVEFMKAGARDYLSKSRISAADLCSAVVAQLSPHAMRAEIALYRERERAIDAELGAALARVSFLAETGKLLAATRDYNRLLELAVTRALPFLGEASFVDLIEADVLHRRCVHVEGDAGLCAARRGLALVAPSSLSLTGVARAIRDGVKLYVTGKALLEAGRDDRDIAVLTGAGASGGGISALALLGTGNGRPHGGHHACRRLYGSGALGA